MGQLAPEQPHTLALSGALSVATEKNVIYGLLPPPMFVPKTPSAGQQQPIDSGTEND